MFRNLRVNRSAKPASSEGGFTLVELAIALVIIGLLIGGVLKGQEMITNAKIKSTARMVDGYRAAVISFRDKYRYLPGDFPGANRVLGAPNDINWVTCFGNKPNRPCNGDYRIVNSESLYFWQHLVAADLISGVQLMNNPVGGLGITYPKAPIGGGFRLVLETVHGKSDQYLKLRKGDMNFQRNWGIVQPEITMLLDQKFDDGSPLSGSIMAVQHRDGHCYSSATGDWSFNGLCAVLFTLE